MEIREKDMKVLLKSQQGELVAVLMYNALAEVAKRFAEVKSVRNDENRHGDMVKGLLKK